MDRKLTRSIQFCQFGRYAYYKSVYFVCCHLNNRRLRVYCLSEFYGVLDTRDSNLLNMEWRTSLDAVFRWLTAVTSLIDKTTHLR